MVDEREDGREGLLESPWIPATATKSDGLIPNVPPLVDRTSGKRQLFAHREDVFLPVDADTEVSSDDLESLIAQQVSVGWGAFLIILVVSIGTVGYGVGRPEEVLSFLLLAGIALIAHPAGRGILRRGDSFSPAMLALVAIAAIPLAVFMVNQFGLSANTLDPHAHDGHYVMMAGLAFAPIAYGAFAAFGFVGWRLASWLAAIPMAYYGLMSVSFTTQAGSTGILWGMAAIVWALAFVAVAEYSRVSSSTSLRRYVTGEPS